MAVDKTRRTGTPLQDLLRGARRPVEPDPVERELAEPEGARQIGTRQPAPVTSPPSVSMPRDAEALDSSAKVPRELERATPSDAPSAHGVRATTDVPAARDATYDPVTPRSVAGAAGPIAAASSGADRVGGSDASTLARRGQKARPTILIEPADHQTLRDWQAEAAAEWQARVLDDSKIVRALIQAARDARVPIGTAGGEAHLRRLLVGVMRRGMAGGPD